MHTAPGAVAGDKELDLPLKKLSNHPSNTKIRSSVRGTGRNQRSTVHNARFKGIGSSIL